LPSGQQETQAGDDQQRHQELNRRTWPTTRRLLPDRDRVIMYRQQYFAFFTSMEHKEMTLSLEGKARKRALAKARRLNQVTAATAPSKADPEPSAATPAESAVVPAPGTADSDTGATAPGPE